MVSSAMQSLLELRVVSKSMSHHQTIQQILQLLQEGFKVGCNLERQRKRTAKAKDKDGGKGNKGGRGGL